jgi:hypothetical protein
MLEEKGYNISIILYNLDVPMRVVSVLDSWTMQIDRAQI